MISMNYVLSGSELYSHLFNKYAYINAKTPYFNYKGKYIYTPKNYENKFIKEKFKRLSPFKGIINNDNSKLKNNNIVFNRSVITNNFFFDNFDKDFLNDDDIEHNNKYINFYIKNYGISDYFKNEDNMNFIISDRSKNNYKNRISISDDIEDNKEICLRYYL